MIPLLDPQAWQGAAAAAATVTATTAAAAAAAHAAYPAGVGGRGVSMGLLHCLWATNVMVMAGIPAGWPAPRVRWCAAAWSSRRSYLQHTGSPHDHPDPEQ